MDGFKMVRLFLVLAFAMSVASQPLENIGGATLSTHFFNWAQVGFEAFLEWAKRGFRLNTDEENTTTTTSEPMSKLLILTGLPASEAKKIEVVDLQNPLNSCTLPEEFPTRLTSAVGGFTNDRPLLCSGYNSYTDSRSNACFTLKNSKFTEVEVKLQTERSGASAVVLPNGELWIQGGWDGNDDRLSTTETISLEGSQTGMELEKGIRSHCSMMINATTGFITGGYTGSGRTKDTYFVDIHNWKWTKGPQMEERRAYHGCSLFMHNNHNYALVSGGFDLSSTEILDLNSGILEWTKGPELPVKMYRFPLVSTSQGIMAVGGYDYWTNTRNKDEILLLKCQDGQEPNKCKWEEFPKKLDVARSDHVVIPLPASYEICNN